MPTRKIVAAVIWLFALVMAYPYLPGSGSAAFQGVSVLVGLMLSLGASSIVSQGASGLILTYSRTFKPGEYVRIGDHEGTITDLGIFNTRMRTGMGEEITLANSTVFSSVTKNYSRPARQRRLHSRHHGDHRLRHAMAAGRGHAAGSRQAHRGHRRET